MSDYDLPSFDLDDPDLLFDATKYEPRVKNNDGDEADVDEDMKDEMTRPLVEEQSSSASVRMSEPGPIPERYPNLQVTQSMLQPRKMRRHKSADVDCFQ